MMESLRRKVQGRQGKLAGQDRMPGQSPCDVSGYRNERSGGQHLHDRAREHEEGWHGNTTAGLYDPQEAGQPPLVPHPHHHRREGQHSQISQEPPQPPRKKAKTASPSSPRPGKSMAKVSYPPCRPFRCHPSNVEVLTTTTEGGHPVHPHLGLHPQSPTPWQVLQSAACQLGGDNSTLPPLQMGNRAHGLSHCSNVDYQKEGRTPLYIDTPSPCQGVLHPLGIDDGVPGVDTSGRYFNPPRPRESHHMTRGFAYQQEQLTPAGYPPAPQQGVPVCWPQSWQWQQ